MAMMAITTRSSIRVKQLCFTRPWAGKAVMLYPPMGGGSLFSVHLSSFLLQHKIFHLLISFFLTDRI
jgi:hypothetical protein